MSLMDKVRWGIIGCGDVTEMKSGPALQKAPGSSLVAVMRRNGQLAEDYARRHQVPRWYDDAGALIRDSEVNAVYVATPPSSHREYVLASAAAGKTVYVEKPMALNHAECLEMIEACDRAGVPLFVAYYRRALPRFLKIREIINSGALGEIRFVNINFFQAPAVEQFQADTLPWRVRPEISGGGLFLDLGSHMLDFLDFLFGPIVQAEGRATNQGGYYQAEDLVTGRFSFRSGIEGVGNWCFAAFGSLDQTEIVGSRGRLRYSTFDEEPIVLETTSETRQFEVRNPPHVQQPLVEMVVAALLEQGECPSTGVSGARTNRVMDRLLGKAEPGHPAE